MTRFARFLALVLAFCLPMQAAVALEMSARAAFPAGQGGVAGAVSVAASAHDEQASHCPHETPAAADVATDDCPTSCVVCHFACSGFMPTAAATPPERRDAHVLVPTLRILADQVAPDRLRRPPRATA